MNTKTTEQQTDARYSLQRGQPVIVDGKYQGHITETMIGDGSFYRVEVDTYKEKREWWTVNFDRMEIIPPTEQQPYKTTLNLPGRSNSEYLRSNGWNSNGERELWEHRDGGLFSIQMALAIQRQWDKQEAQKQAKQRQEIIKTPGPIGRAFFDGVTEHRSTAFVSGLQQARIDALDTALVKLVTAGDALLEYWQHGTPVNAGSDVAADFKAAMDAAHRTLA